MKNFYTTGDNLPFLASQIVAPQHASGDNYTNLVGPGVGATTPVNLVEDGDVCVIGRMVGISNSDAIFATDTIVVSFRGVYTVPVTALYGAGIHIGETVYANPTTAVLSDDSTGVPAGTALAFISHGSTSTIQVKLFGATDGATGFGS
jgi:predicted RecA/RadA family phage recombinase